MTTDLRDVPESALRRELFLRHHCADCRTEWSRGWHSIDGARRHRVVCRTCAAGRRLEARRGRAAAVPLLVAGERS